MGKLFSSNDIDINIPEDDFAELKNRTYRKFGWPKVNIEITNDDFIYIIKTGLMFLSTWVPKIVDIPLYVKAHQSVYNLTDYENINAILDVGVSTSYLIGMGVPMQALLPMPMSLAASNNISLVEDFMSLISAHNTAKQVFQVFPMPELRPPNQVIITPEPYMDDTWLLKVTLNHESNLGSLNKWEREWLIRYCQAGVGKFIGQIRRKYDGVQLPVGTLSGSGGSIFSESLEEEKSLMEELKIYKKMSEMYINIG